MILMLTLFEEEKQPAQVWTLDNDHDVKNVNCLWTTSPGMTMIMMLTLFEDERKTTSPGITMILMLRIWIVDEHFLKKEKNYEN